MGGVFSSTDDAGEPRSLQLHGEHEKHELTTGACVTYAAGDYVDAGEYDARNYDDAGGQYAKHDDAYSYQSCSRSDLHNSNNDCYWRAHGYKKRPSDVGDVHASYSNANNPNNSTYGSPAEHPNDYVARRCAIATHTCLPVALYSAYDASMQQHDCAIAVASITTASAVPMHVKRGQPCSRLLCTSSVCAQQTAN